MRPLLGVFVLMSFVAAERANAETREMAFNSCKLEVLKLRDKISGHVEREYVSGDAGKFVTACMISKGFKRANAFPGMDQLCNLQAQEVCFEGR
jgi:hypothetical protein